LKKFLRRTLRSLLLLFLLAFVVYCWTYFPLMTAYVAKATCSGVFVSGRAPGDIEKQDFYFPFTLAKARVDFRDSSVTAYVFGLARRKAIYRRGLGATLLNGMTEQALRQQPVALAAIPSPFDDTLPWPQGDRLADTIPAGLDKSRLTTAMEAAFYDTLHKRPFGTRALLVVYRGQIVAERYAPGFSATTPLISWSMTKSITNALLGVMVQQQRLDLHTPAPVAAWQPDDRRNITWINLMQMTSGLRFTTPLILPSDDLNMLFKEKNMAAFAAGLPLKHPPGTVFHYSDGNVNILSGLIRARLGDSDYYRFPYEQLFYKIGMHHTLLETDPGGNFAASSFSYGTARDWARFGLLYLHDGVWRGERLLPKGWVSWTATPSGIHDYESFSGEYGELWWTNATGRGDFPRWRFMPDVPADCFFSWGFDGQFVFVIPSKDLVIVRLSLAKDEQPAPNLMLYGLLQAFSH
jgi:CubicO group peptidase (beta-lactamase class C family)